MLIRASSGGGGGTVRTGTTTVSGVTTQFDIGITNPKYLCIYVTNGAAASSNCETWTSWVEGDASFVTREYDRGYRDTYTDKVSISGSIVTYTRTSSNNTGTLTWVAF